MPAELPISCDLRRFVQSENGRYYRAFCRSKARLESGHHVAPTRALLEPPPRRRCTKPFSPNRPAVIVGKTPCDTQFSTAGIWDAGAGVTSAETACSRCCPRSAPRHQRGVKRQRPMERPMGRRLISAAAVVGAGGYLLARINTKDNKVPPVAIERCPSEAAQIERYPSETARPCEADQVERCPSEAAQIERYPSETARIP